MREDSVLTRHRIRLRAPSLCYDDTRGRIVKHFPSFNRDEGKYRDG